jgi:large subunit ribosomal protein L29
MSLQATTFGFEMKPSELREMSDEQLELTAVDAAETMFKLRLQSQTERVDVPTQMRHNRRLIARVRTIQSERAKKKA